MNQFANCYCEKLTNILIDCLKENRFPNLIELTEISPVFKKLDNKDNYRPISTLSNFAKLFENIIYLPLNDYKKNKFSEYLTFFRKNHNKQNSLLRMIELNNGSNVGVIVIDLLKAFDSLNYNLLLAKLEAYG